ncbi:MAG: phosphatase PAP2 family protein [Candidatus Daviesbacteria bacterium]|nr:phosphatase PAP2 family protein [Candidatus Daviesbacteria bacterium]
MFLFLALSITFIIFSFLVTQGLFLSIDQYIDQAIFFQLDSPLYFISRFLAFIYVPLILIVIALFIRFLLKKQTNEALITVMVSIGALVAEFVLKPIFNIRCPQNYYTMFMADQEVFGLLRFLQSYGFFETCYPSSHVASYVVLCGYLAYLVLKHIKEKWPRYLWLSILFTLIILVGPSRLYLHAHWFSDVIGGYLLGFALLALIISLHKRLIR